MLRDSLRLILLAASLAAIHPLRAMGQLEHFDATALQAVGGIFTIIPDQPSQATTNAALLVHEDSRLAAELSYSEPYGMSELEQVSLYGKARLHRLGFGIGIARAGQSGLYQETAINLAVAFRVRPELGVGGTFTHLRTEFGDNTMAFAGSSLAFSVSASPVASILIGATARNLVTNDLYEGEINQPIGEVSIAWSAPPDVTIGGSWTKQRRGDSRFGLGQVIRLHKSVDFLAGLRFDPVRFSLGGELAFHGASLVYCYQGHPDLGATHSFGLAWRR